MPHSILQSKHVETTMFDNCGDLDDFETSTVCFVKLNMGPYEANGIIRHRMPRIKGLQDFLSKSGYNVELEDTSHLDRFTMDFYEREIFRCNIKNFQFNLPAEEDPLCMKAIQTLQEHEARFCTDSNIPKFVNVHHGMRFLELNKLYTTADCLSGSDIQLLFEIKDNIVEEEPKSSEVSVISNSTEDIDNDYSFSELTDEPKLKISEKVRISLNENKLPQENYKQKQVFKASLVDSNAMVYIDVLDRASKNIRMRHASIMFKSGEIRAMEVGTGLASGIYSDLKPENKNQKIISKVISHRNKQKKIANK